ncbi:hypothetical protein BVX99_00190, partial [bacterium F16]
MVLRDDDEGEKEEDKNNRDSTQKTDAVIPIIDTEHVSVSVSNGSDLGVTYPVYAHAPSHSLYLMKTWDQPMLVRINSVQAKDTELTFAVFFSRRKSLPTVHPYRNLIDLPDTPIKLKRYGDATATPYWPAMPEKPIELSVTGPTRLKVSTRFIPAADQREPEVNYSLTVRLGDTTLQPIDLFSSIETGRPMEVDGIKAMLGQETEAYIDVPDGDQIIMITPTIPIYLRVLARIDSDYLFASLNEPETGAKSLYDDNVLPRIPDDWRSRWLTADPSVLDEIVDAEALANAVRRTNRFKGGGSMALRLLDAAAEKRPDIPEAAKKAKRFRFDGTFYRDLVPSQTSPVPVEEFTILPQELRDINDWHREKSLSREHLLS